MADTDVWAELYNSPTKATVRTPINGAGPVAAVNVKSNTDCDAHAPDTTDEPRDGANESKLAIADALLTDG